jgi:propionaldehyde dehydrogenase
MNEKHIEELVRKILRDEFSSLDSGGVYRDINDAVGFSKRAFAQYVLLSLSERERVIETLKKDLRPLIAEMAQMSVDETFMGRAEDKAEKISLSIEKTPGVEDLITEVKTGDGGMTLFELSPWGVICAIHPCTNPCATVINNTIGMLAAGNAVIHIPHPRASAITKHLVKAISKSICKSCGIENLVVTLYESSMAAADELMAHPDIQMIVVTGGGDVLRRAMSSGKKVIGAGPANPVVIVDETADIRKAAHDILEGASFDNNIMCITEKSVVVADCAADSLIRAMEQGGAKFLGNLADVQSLMNEAVTRDGAPNKSLEGKSSSEILNAAGISFSGTPKAILFETEKENPFVALEVKMPVLPIVRARDFDEALEYAIEIEQGFRHTAILHSQSIERLNRAAKSMQTSVFVKNGPSLAGIGVNGEGNTSFTIATATGEGTTSARHFCRRRRCTLTESFSIR